MALTSSQVMQQIRDMGDMPDFKKQITEAYNDPVLKPLVNEGAELEGGYLPAIFDPFTQWGTGAADLSPAAKLSSIGNSLGNLESRIASNYNMQNFFDAQITDLANKESSNWRTKLDNMWRQYSALAQEEQARRAAAAQRAQALNYQKYMNALRREQQGGRTNFTAGTQTTNFSPTGSAAFDVVYNAGKGIASMPIRAAQELFPADNATRQSISDVAMHSPFLRDASLKFGDLFNRALGSNDFAGYYTPGAREWANSFNRPMNGAF